MSKSAIHWLYEAYRKENIVTDNVFSLFKTAEKLERDNTAEASLYGWRKALDEQSHSIDPNEFYDNWFKTE